MTPDDSTLRTNRAMACEDAVARPHANRRVVGKVFGLVVRELRIAKGLSQEEVALLGDFDRTYPSLLERGKRTPTLPFIFHLALVFEVHPATLVREAFERYQRHVGVRQSSLAAVTALAPPRRRQQQLTPQLVQGWVRHRVPLRALRDPLRALGILEASVKGETFKHCAARFGLTPARCEQLARLAAVMLLQPKFVQNDEIPCHDWSLARKRVANRVAWLRLIERARGMLKGSEDSEVSAREQP